MSGICALWDFRGGLAVRERAGAMLAALDRFGPDGAALHDADTVALGCAHMRVLREDQHDAQPLVARDGAVVVVADVRLDNRSALGHELGLAPGDLATMADGALVLHAYLRWGDRCPTRLLGDFAFIVWDADRQRLLCARDHTGKRVLFYHATPGLFAVASSVRALLAAPEIPAKLNEEKVAESLVLVERSDSTFYDGISRLQPGHVLSVEGARLRLECYWAPDPARRVTLRSDEEYVEAFLDIFHEAVRGRLRTDGEVGVMVSGGLDSPTVAAVAAAELLGAGRSLHAFHAAPPAGFDGVAYPGWVVDESDDVVSMTALHPNMLLSVERPDGRTLLDGLDDFFDVTGAPLRNPINRAWFEQLYELAEQRGVRAMLSGQRGNATFSHTGLPGLREYFTTGRWLTLRREIRARATARGYSPRSVLRHQVLEPVLPSWVWPLYRRLRGAKRPAPKPPREQMASPIHPAFAEEIGVDERIRAAGIDGRGVRTADGRTQRIRLLTGTADGPDLLHAFRTRYGIESRDPCADVRVIDYCLAIPESQYLRAGTDRWLVRRAMAGRLPDRLLYRTTRGTQSADWPQQMDRIREELGREVAVLRNNHAAARCLDLDRMEQLVRNWPQRLGLEHHYDYGLLLLRGIMMGRFIRWFDEQRWHIPGPRATALSAAAAGGVVS